MLAVHFCWENHDTVCVVANDTDIYLSLINISDQICSHIYFRQGKTKDKDGANYHDTHVIPLHLGEEIYQIPPCFHTMTDFDFTYPFFSHSKIKGFKKLLEVPKSHKPLLSFLSAQPNIDEVTNLFYTLHLIDHVK